MEDKKIITAHVEEINYAFKKEHKSWISLPINLGAGFNPSDHGQLDNLSELSRGFRVYGWENRITGGFSTENVVTIHHGSLPNISINKL